MNLGRIVYLSIFLPTVVLAQPPVRHPRRVPAWLSEGPKTAWTRCAALALEPKAAAGECTSEDGKTSCGSITVQWHGLAGSVFLGTERVGDAHQTAEVSAVVVGGLCEIRLDGGVVYVESSGR